MDELLTIGEVGRRTGLATSAIRFYEAQGLISADRTDTGQRRFHRAILRVLAFIRVAQRIGLKLEEIKSALDTLPDNRTPTKADWQRLSQTWRPRLDEQIKTITELRDTLTDCIGCGCLSLKSCQLYNPGDAAAELGDGPRFLLGNTHEDVKEVIEEGPPKRRRSSLWP